MLLQYFVDIEMPVPVYRYRYVTLVHYGHTMDYGTYSVAINRYRYACTRGIIIHTEYVCHNIITYQVQWLHTGIPEKIDIEIDRYNKLLER